VSAIDKVPSPQEAMTIKPQMLAALNERLLTAQLRASEARELEAKLALARIEAARAADVFVAARNGVSQALGVAIGTTHGWDMSTGEVTELVR